MDSPRRRNNNNIKTIAGQGGDCQEPSVSTLFKNLHISSTDHPEVVFIEPFYGGSHQQLIDTLHKHIPNSHLIVLSNKKWHWRARCGALILSTIIPVVTTEKVLFCSSVLSLAELVGIRPDLQKLKKIVFFHENQLVYPIREIKQRDIQFAYNQITTCLAADVVIFNSHYNRTTFLDNLINIIKIFPDNKPKDLRVKIEAKCMVLYFPLSLEERFSNGRIDVGVLHIAWPHRWEFDKDPEFFINILKRLKSDNVNFRVSLLGETFADIPEVFDEAKEVLKDEIVNYGFIEDKEEYFKILQSCHIAVSTAKHEFYGVSMLEATFYGCLPLVPNRLVYPEIYPAKCLYSDETELYLRLKQYCLVPDLAVQHRVKAIKLERLFSPASQITDSHLQLL
ncbi:hypothetical protein RN001_015556 [Aquatica leii]|uniref:tRNA-queuosine alpha-mannosyltransferase n=1 Tax=Aquatica leii TaxID=1421715 RepID=A0AAN7SC42_9COLE|nr:hypothetical protein RN001_015556 [Aquatica leii]